MSYSLGEIIEMTKLLSILTGIQKNNLIKNFIDNLNRKIRKYTKAKFSFPSDMPSKRPFIFHLWRLRRNGHSQFITGT